MMGSKWFTGGVAAAPHGRIQFDFMFEGVRYRPSVRRPPSEANLRRARDRLEEIQRQIDAGTFSFAEEFPDYRFLRRLTGVVRVRSCSEVFDEFLKHCESRLLRHDLAAATVSSYRRVLNGVWRPALRTHLFHQVRYSRLVAIADSKAWSKKTYNNAISIEAQGNYDEFRFLTGMRPSEEIALVLSDLDLVSGIISVNKARVAGIDRCQTKTGEDRRIVLCPRALAVLKRQLALRARFEAADAIGHDHVFFRETGEPFWNLQMPGKRWRASLNSLKLRYRRPYTARHSSVSWNLMIGKNPLWVAKQHGHSISTMLRVYAAWAGGRGGRIRRRRHQAIHESPRSAQARPAAEARHSDRKVTGIWKSGSRSASRDRIKNPSP
jgi:integrase